MPRPLVSLKRSRWHTWNGDVKLSGGKQRKRRKVWWVTVGIALQIKWLLFFKWVNKMIKHLDMCNTNIFRLCFSMRYIYYRETYNNFISWSDCMLPPLPQVFLLSWRQLHTCKMCTHKHTKTITNPYHIHTDMHTDKHTSPFKVFLALDDPINKA